MRGTICSSAVLCVFVLGCGSDSWEPAPSAPPVVSEPLIGAPAKPVRTIAGLMFDLGSGPPNATMAETVWMGATNSVRGLYIESSYGVQDIDVDFHGPYTLPVANRCLTLACCGPSSDDTGNGAEVQRVIDALPTDYMHYGYLYGRQTDNGCGTWGDAGNPNRPAVYSSYEQSSLLGGAQEIGHNLGMAHEHTMDCGGQTMPDNLASCSNVEYGSRLSFMGMGRGHPSAYHKVHMGWLSGCNIVRAGGEGTFTLFPLETPCNATQVIQVAAPKSRPPPSGTNTNITHYYLEHRVPVGYDSSAVNGPQVMIYISGDFSMPNQYARHTFLLDLTPSTPELSDAGLRMVGQSFADPGGGLTFTLEAVSMTSATLRISGNGTGAHTCLGGMPFTAPGPADCGMGPGGGGMGGSAGGGTAGSSTGGAAGFGGAGGTGAGVSGSAGSGAAGGAPPTGGTGGSLTTGGTSGSSATGGAAGVSTGGGGGVATGGGAGAAVAGTGSGVAAAGDELDGGCGCRTAGKRPNGSLLTSLALLFLLRRRRARA